MSDISTTGDGRAHDADEVQAAMGRAQAIYERNRRRARTPLAPEDYPAVVELIDEHHAVVFHPAGRANENHGLTVRRLGDHGIRVVSSLRELRESRASHRTARSA